MNGYITNNMIATDVWRRDGSLPQIGIGIVSNGAAKQEEQFNLEDKIYIYEDCKLNSTKMSLMPEKDECFNYLTLEQLKSATKYDSDNLGLSATNRYNTNDHNYFPSLKEPSQSTSSLNDMWKTKLGIESVKILIESEEASTLNLKDLVLAEFGDLPEVYAYSIDVDKLNIEFSSITPYTFFEIKTAEGKTIIEKTPIEQRVYTFKYDFNTDFIITISNLRNWYDKNISPKDVRNMLDIQNEEYIYLTNNTIQSNKRNFEGEFVNIFKGKALSNDGIIYELANMKSIDKLNSVFEAIENSIPITQIEYNGTKIQTFYHCSKVIDGEQYSYKDKQIFMKNESMYIVDGEINAKGDSIIIDSYNNNQYEAILGTDGVIYNLLTKIKYPDGFKNENIIDMTTNIDSNQNIVLVVY